MRVDWLIMEPMLETLFTINYSESNFIPKLDKRVYSQEHIGYNQCPGCSHTDNTLGPVNHSLDSGEKKTNQKVQTP